MLRISTGFPTLQNSGTALLPAKPGNSTCDSKRPKISILESSEFRAPGLFQKFRPQVIILPKDVTNDRSVVNNSVGRLPVFLLPG